MPTKSTETHTKITTEDIQNIKNWLDKKRMQFPIQKKMFDLGLLAGENAIQEEFRPAVWIDQMLWEILEYRQNQLKQAEETRKGEETFHA